MKKNKGIIIAAFKTFGTRKGAGTVCQLFHGEYLLAISIKRGVTRKRD